MAFEDLKHRLDKVKNIYSKQATDRYKHLDALERVLNSTIFNDCFDPSFDQEKDVRGEYIPVKQRRPALVYNLAKIIVDHTTALAFGEKHAPSIRMVTEEDDPTALAKMHKQMEHLIEQIELASVCEEAMRVGSVGSVAVVLYQLEDDKMPWFDVLQTKYCKPFFDPRDPRKLVKVERVYDNTIDDLEQGGYDPDAFDPDEAPYWIRIVYTEQGELRSDPLPNKKYERLGEKDDEDPTKRVWWTVDEDRSYANAFDFMNVLWVRNFGERKGVDGKSSFEEAIDWMIEISYGLSCIGRGYRYTADPAVAILQGELNAIGPIGGFTGDENGGAQTEIVRSPSRTINVPPGGDIKMLEITGQGLSNAADYVRMLREYAMEVISGMKADQQHATSVHSGRALEILHQALIWLVAKFHVAYGTRCFIPLLRMVLQGIEDGVLEIPGVEINDFDPAQPFSLDWPEWETLTGTELFNTIQAYEMAAGGSPQTPVPLLPHEYAAQKTAEAVGIVDANRSTALLMKARPDQTLPIDQKDQELENQARQTEIAAQKPVSSGNK